MKFRVARDDLADAVAWVAKSLPTRPPVPVLGGILLEVRGSTLTVAGFDYEVSTRAEISVDTVDALDDDAAGEPSADRVLVSGRLLAEITRALPAKPVDFSVDGPRVTSSAGRPGSPCRPCRSRTTRRCRRCRARRAPSTRPPSPRPSRRPRSPPAATTRCRC